MRLAPIITVIAIILMWNFVWPHSSGVTKLRQSTTVEAQSFEGSDNLKILRRINLGGHNELVVTCDHTNGYLYVVASNDAGVALQITPNDCSRRNPR